MSVMAQLKKNLRTLNHRVREVVAYWLPDGLYRKVLPDEEETDGNQSATRSYHCTHCGKLLEVSAKAFSVNCRHCNQRVSLEDYYIDTHHAITNIETSGHVAVTESGHVRAKICVEDLHIEGHLFGNVTAQGKVSVSSNGYIIGNVSARKLEVQDGAKLHGYFTIGREAPDKPVKEANSVRSKKPS